MAHSACIFGSSTRGRQPWSQHPKLLDELLLGVYSGVAVHILVEGLQNREAFQLLGNALPAELPWPLQVVASDTADKVGLAAVEVCQQLCGDTHLQR